MNGSSLIRGVRYIINWGNVSSDETKNKTFTIEQRWQTHGINFFKGDSHI